MCGIAANRCAAGTGIAEDCVYETKSHGQRGVPALSLSVHPCRIPTKPRTNLPISISDSTTRLAALVGLWDVPDPDELAARLQSEPDVAHRFYERRCA